MTSSSRNKYYNVMYLCSLIPVATGQVSRYRLGFFGKVFDPINRFAKDLQEGEVFHVPERACDTTKVYWNAAHIHSGWLINRWSWQRKVVS